jgi:SAM-dependent methyltransferase
MTRNHWKDYHSAWSQLTVPLRPNHEVVAAVRDQIGAGRGPTLLLGVTPELADIASDLVAVDRNFAMVSHVWPGNTAARRALVGDWRNTNFAPGSFAACVGDNSICVLPFPEGAVSLCERLFEALQAGGRFVCREFVAPDTPESLSAVRDAAASGAIRNFHAFKFRLAMAIAARAGGVGVCVHEIFSVFTEMFPDRRTLERITGWPRGHIDTIDFYEGSAVVFYFPTRAQLLSIVPPTFANVRLVPVGTFELAERSPLLVMDKPRE